MPEGLKKGWTRVAFGDVVRQVRDRVDPQEAGLERYVAGEHMDTDDLRIRRWGTVGDGYLGPAFHMRFKPGHVLYGSRRTYLRKVAVAHFEGITANTTFVLEPKEPDALLPELLPFIMQTESFHEHSIKQSKGSVNPYINFSDLAWYEFALPPLEEQRRIALVLRASHELIESTRRLGGSIHVAKFALLERAIGGISGASLLPVADLLLEPPRNGLSPAPSVDTGNVMTVSISAVRHGDFNPEGCLKHATVDAEFAQHFIVESGDAFVIRGNGNRYLCGKAGLSEHSYEALIYPDLLIRLRFNPELIIAQFATAQWNLPSVHGRLVARAKSSNGIWKVNGQDIREHRLAVPPMVQQQRITERLDVLRHRLGDVSAREAAAKRLAAALARKAWGVDD